MTSAPDDVDYDEYVQTLNSSNEKSEGFWNYWLMESQETFSRGRESIEADRNMAGELIKIDLLIASVIYGVLGLLGQGISPLFIALPFVPLVLALALLITSYRNLSPKVLGASLGNVNNSLKRDQEVKEAKIEMTAVYQKWTDSNEIDRRKSSKFITWAVVIMFISLGMATGILLVPLP